MAKKLAEMTPTEREAYLEEQRRFVESERRRIAASRPLTEAEKMAMERREFGRAHAREAELEAARVRGYIIQHKPIGRFPVEVDSIKENEATTVCLKRKEWFIVQDPDTKREVYSEKRESPPHCRTFPRVELECIDRKADAPDCELVEQAFACANDLSATQAAAITNVDKKTVEGCVIDLNVLQTGDVLGERRYTMPHDAARRIREATEE